MHFPLRFGISSAFEEIVDCYHISFHTMVLVKSTVFIIFIIKVNRRMNRTAVARLSILRSFYMSERYRKTVSVCNGLE